MPPHWLHHQLHQQPYLSVYYTAILNNRRTNSQLLFRNVNRQDHPELLLKSLVIPARPEEAGELIRCVALPWYLFLEMIQRDPDSIYQIEARVWEELVAGAYKRAGFEVVLTPRSGDFGRDVIATKNGVGSIRIFDDVKAYKPGHVVDALEVRAMLASSTVLRTCPRASLPLRRPSPRAWVRIHSSHPRFHTA